jgi:hypothetical protein
MESNSFIEWISFENIKTPFMRKIISFTQDTISFDGYFYLEDDVMPVERILSTEKGVYHVEIYEKKTLESTDKSKCVNDDNNDDFESNITFFPTNIIELKYKIISILRSREEFDSIHQRIFCLEENVYKKNLELHEKRMKKEHEEFVEECKNMDYKSFFAQFK